MTIIKYTKYVLMDCIIQTSASMLEAPPSDNDSETAEDELESGQDEVSDEDNAEEIVQDTEDENESNYQGSVSDNEEAVNSQRQTESIDQVPDYTDDQDSSFNPKPIDLKSLDGSEVITNEDIHQEDNLNPSEDICTHRHLK